jgi:sec-independent protein translocase protein TatA
VFNVGPLEIVLVLVIALIVLGPQRLPDVARSVGKGMREFRSALASAGEDDDDEVDERDEPPPKPPAEQAKPPASELPEGS